MTIDLTPDAIEIGEPMARTDATPVTIHAHDNRQNKYIIRYTFRNDHLDVVDSAAKHLVPVRRIH